MITLRIAGSPRDLGGFSVKRLLPHHRRQSVGPFVFFDHLGPATFAPGTGIDVRPHPHIGLATVTYLFEGSLRHRDSLGTVQDIRPGAVNWMVAGRGIQHSERTPPDAREAPHRIHAIQTWVALPKAHEADAPAFSHHPADSLPAIDLDGAKRTLIAGTAFGAASPAPVVHPTFYIAVEGTAGAEVYLPDEHAERGIYVVEGAIDLLGERAEAGTMLILEPGTLSYRMLTDGKAMLFGGAPLDGPRHIWWNLVASDPAMIDAAADAWATAPQGGRFGSIACEEEWIPLPDTPRPAKESATS
jgi:redox-sensitive bicupin YhaK (pirin superfamily)